MSKSAQEIQMAHLRDQAEAALRDRYAGASAESLARISEAATTGRFDTLSETDLAIVRMTVLVATGNEHGRRHEARREVE